MKSKSNKMKNPWLIAIRPKTLTASLSPILIGMTLALSEGHFNPGLLGVIILTTLGIQIATNLTNDYYDFKNGVDQPGRSSKVKVLPEGWITLPAMKKALLCVFFSVMLGSVYLIFKGGWVIALIAASSILFSYLYTAGPFPLGHIGLADPVEFLYFGPVAVGGTYYLLTGNWPLYVTLAGCIPGFLSLAILTVDNLRDIDTDAMANKKTLCVRFGVTFGKLQYTLCIFAGFLMPLVLIALTRDHFYSLISFVTLPLYKKALDAVRANESKESLNQALTQTALNLIVFTFIFCAGWLL